MLVDLAIKTKVLLWSGVVLGILVYAAVRNWNRWKQWRHQRQAQQQRDSAIYDADSADEESGDIPDGQLCVIWLMMRKHSAFVPCGHLVCCQRCALSVEHDLAPRCPLCRQTIHGSVRTYDS